MNESLQQAAKLINDIGIDNRCTCADECPLGKTGSRCTEAELLAAGFSVRSQVIDDLDAWPEFEIVDGQIRTVRP